MLGGDDSNASREPMTLAETDKVWHLQAIRAYCSQSSAQRLDLHDLVYSHGLVNLSCFT